MTNNTPVTDNIANGPSKELYQAILEVLLSSPINAPQPAVAVAIYIAVEKWLEAYRDPTA